jgi:hypothetical protein
VLAVCGAKRKTGDNLEGKTIIFPGFNHLPIKNKTQQAKIDRLQVLNHFIIRF